MLFLILSIIIQAASSFTSSRPAATSCGSGCWRCCRCAGILAYVAVEMLPELLRSRAAQRTARGMRSAMDPTADLRRYESEVRVAGNVASRQRYAEELVRHGRYDEAIAQYREALSGLYEHDPEPHAGTCAGAVRQGRCARRACHAR